MKFSKRAGVSPIIAVLLLILIAIAAGVMVYAFVAGWVGSATSGTTVAQAQLAIDYVEGSGTLVTIYVRNVGGVSAQIDTIYVYEAGGALINVPSTNPTLPVIIAPGDTQKFQLTLSMGLDSGNVYTVKVIASDGSTVISSFKAH